MDIKIKLTYYDLEDNLSVESVWGSKHENYYKIENIPFFAPNIAYGDIVSVEEDGNELFFDELIETSEHSTIQIVFFDQKKIKEVTNKITSLKCNWEGSHIDKYISVDVPCYINYKDLKLFLNQQFKSQVLDYNEACLSDTHKNQIVDIPPKVNT